MGEAKYRGEVMSGEQAMKLAGITPVKLTSKEGLALINGTPAMCAVGALALADAEMLMKSADVIAALSMEAECGIADAMDERLHRVRRQPGQMAVAENMRRLFEGSRYISRQAIAQSVTIIVTDQLRFSVYHGNGSLMACIRAKSASVAKVLINFNNLSYHVFLLHYLRLISQISLKP
jgi:histidine ammonia-lyase